MRGGRSLSRIKQAGREVRFQDLSPRSVCIEAGRCGLLPDPGVGDLGDIHFVEAAVFGSVPPFGKGRVEEVRGFEQLGVENLAFESEAGLLVEDAAVLGDDRMETGCGDFVGVATRFRTGGFVYGTVVGPQEREGEPVALFDEAVGVALGADEDGGYGFVPEVADTAPAGGHGVESVWTAGGDEHPFVADDVDHVVGDGARVDGFHGMVFCDTKKAFHRSDRTPRLMC